MHPLAVFENSVEANLRCCNVEMFPSSEAAVAAVAEAVDVAAVTVMVATR